MIPPSSSPVYPYDDPGPEAAHEAAPWPMPGRCPWCGHHPFALDASGVLDAITIAKEAITEAQAAVEALVLP